MKRDIPTSVLLSLITGRLICEFSEMHEAAEFVVGHSVWSHEFADKLLQQHLRDTILEQHPDLDVDASGVNQENWEAWLREQEATLGKSRTIYQGSEVRHQSPQETLAELAPDTKVITIATPPAGGK